MSKEEKKLKVIVYPIEKGRVCVTYPNGINRSMTEVAFASLLGGSFAKLLDRWGGRVECIDIDLTLHPVDKLP